jgi:hypothetical protein
LISSDAFPDLIEWLTKHGARPVYAIPPHMPRAPTIEQWCFDNDRLLYVFLYAPRDQLPGAWALAPEVGTVAQTASAFAAAEAALGLSETE